MKWTKESPKKAGWYWFRLGDVTLVVESVRVGGKLRAAIDPDAVKGYKWKDVEWSDCPVDEPE